MLSLLVSNSLLSGLDIFLCLARERALYLGESREVTSAIRARKRESEKRGKTGRALRFLCGSLRSPEMESLLAR